MRNRIAIVADRFPPNWGGGTVSAHYHLYRVLKRRGHDVRAFTCFDQARESSKDEIIRRSLPHKGVRLLRRSSNLAFKLIDSGKAAYQTADILVRAWGAVRLQGPMKAYAPNVIVFPDHGAPGLWMRPVPGCRRVLIAHHNPERFLDLDYIEPHSRVDVRMAASVEKKVLGGIDRVICPSRYMAGLYRQTRPFKGPVRVVPNMIDGEFLRGVSPADPRKTMGLSPGAPLVYIPGGGNKFKGAHFVPEIVRTLLTHSNGALGVFISGAVGPELRRSLENLSPHLRLFLPGTLDGEALIGVVKACSFAVYPTLVENYSMALLEAALCGVPVATFDVGGNGEIIRDGLNGFLIPPYDISALAAAAAHMLDSDRLAEMKQLTLADGAARLSDEAIAEAYEQALLGD